MYNFKKTINYILDIYKQIEDLRINIDDKDYDICLFLLQYVIYHNYLVKLNITKPVCNYYDSSKMDLYNEIMLNIIKLNVFKGTVLSNKYVDKYGYIEKQYDLNMSYLHYKHDISLSNGNKYLEKLDMYYENLDHPFINKIYNIIRYREIIKLNQNYKFKFNQECFKFKLTSYHLKFEDIYYNLKSLETMNMYNMYNYNNLLNDLYKQKSNYIIDTFIHFIITNENKQNYILLYNFYNKHTDFFNYYINNLYNNELIYQISIIYIQIFIKNNRYDLIENLNDLIFNLHLPYENNKYEIKYFNFKFKFDYYITITQHKYTINYDIDDDICSICHEELNNISDTKIKCNGCKKQIGHWNCLFTWFINNESCPLCRF
jgi:hypothetical protein